MAEEKQRPKVEDLIKRLGRIPVKDERDKRFPMRAILPRSTGRKWRYWWSNGWWGDQGNTSQCVAYAWIHWKEDGPVTQDKNAAKYEPEWIYKEAQKIDQWPGENYDGTSVRAGAKILKREGFIKEYRWTWDVETLALAILTEGPVVVGTNWYMSMFEPDPETHLLELDDHPAGGHAYVINGVNTEKRIFRIKNSWGRNWGKNGHAYISYENMQQLLNEYGEAALAIEIRKPPAE